MADAAPNTATAVWNTTVAHRATLIQNHDPALDECLVAVEEQLLDLDAPDLAGVIVKLEILWDGQLHGQDQDSEHKLAVVADLRRLAA
jgi:hypothetical protein